MEAAPEGLDPRLKLLVDPKHVKQLENLLRERLKLKYMGSCKCDKSSCEHCQLVPHDVISAAADALQVFARTLEVFFPQMKDKI